jgi:hypothetical protein
MLIDSLGLGLTSTEGRAGRWDVHSVLGTENRGIGGKVLGPAS